MPFYTFDQNNTGGSFDHDAESGIGYAVAIEASSAAEANKRAKSIGIYFNGCDDDRDCPCCGDRWYPACEDEGSEQPERYGQPLKGAWGIPSYVHYADGSIVEVGEAA